MPTHMDNAIFTSQNAVRSFLKSKAENTSISKVFCVGQKTASILSENGLNVIKIEENAAKLANFITKSFENESFYFLSGNLRKEEISNIQKTSKNSIFELKTYETTLNPMKIVQFFDGIMFFSPSGVQSFMAENSIESAKAFCIGETTASEAKKHTKNVVIATSTSIESVIAKTVKNLLKND